MRVIEKLKKYFSLAYRRGRMESPRMLIFFVTSTCNQSCGHCFYHASLNKRNDLSLEEIDCLSRDLGPIDNILFSGGEPFSRLELPEIASLFYRNNGTRRFSIPTNATLLDRMAKALRAMQEICPEAEFDINVSFDGLEATHNAVRHFDNAFQRSMSNCERILEKFSNNPRIRFHVVSTVMDKNVAELAELAEYLERRFHGRLGISYGFLRGDPKEKSLNLPPVHQLEELHRKASYKYQTWAWFSNFVYNLQFEAKLSVLRTGQQAVPCVGGDLMGVVYADGSVSSCELLPSFGSLREGRSFRELWNSEKARKQRDSICKKECACTHECFMYPSLMFNKWSPFFVGWYGLKSLIRAILRTPVRLERPTSRQHEIVAK